MVVTLQLPFPPSTNRLWRSRRRSRNGKAQVYLCPRYQAWRKEADFAIIEARRQGIGYVTGPFRATIVLDERKRRANSDADNRVKAVLDTLTRMMVIDDDSKANEVTVRWGEADGCKVTVVPWPA